MTGLFQLTPSRRATQDQTIMDLIGTISTHALTEGDREIILPLLKIVISTHALTEGDLPQESISYSS